MATQLCADSAAPLSFRMQTQGEVGSMGNAVSVVKLYKSGGVAQRSTSSRQQARSARIKEYFYGPDGSLQPVSVDLDATNMRVFRSGELGMLLIQSSEAARRMQALLLVFAFAKACISSCFLTGKQAKAPDPCMPKQV
jgi:hypothetical protein